MVFIGLYPTDAGSQLQLRAMFDEYLSITRQHALGRGPPHLTSCSCTSRPVSLGRSGYFLLDTPGFTLTRAQSRKRDWALVKATPGS